MTTKLTLTIDDAVIEGAKKYARKRGRSLSKIVENYLRSISSSEQKPEAISPKVLKLLGSVSLPDDFDYKSSLSKAISKKHEG